MVYAESVRVGGDRFDESIVTYVRRNYGSLIGESTAERIKQEIGTAFPGGELREVDARPQLAEGVPRSFTLNSNEVLEALQESRRPSFRRSRVPWSSRRRNWPPISPSAVWY